MSFASTKFVLPVHDPLTESGQAYFCVGVRGLRTSDFQRRFAEPTVCKPKYAGVQPAITNLIQSAGLSPYGFVIVDEDLAQDVGRLWRQACPLQQPFLLGIDAANSVRIAI